MAKSQSLNTSGPMKCSWDAHYCQAARILQKMVSIMSTLYTKRLCLPLRGRKVNCDHMLRYYMGLYTKFIGHIINMVHRTYASIQEFSNSCLKGQTEIMQVEWNSVGKAHFRQTEQIAMWQGQKKKSKLIIIGTNNFGTNNFWNQ